MSRTKPYGRAFKITEAEASAYEKTRRPRAYKPNPLGVTAMAAVNGRGSYRSARKVAAGKTTAQRTARARSVMRNGDEDMPKRAGFLKNRIGTRMSPGQKTKSLAKAAATRKKNAAAAKRRATIAAKKGSKPAAPKKAAAPKKRASTKTASPVQRRGGKRLAAYSSALRMAKSKGLSQEAAEKRAKSSALRNVPLKKGDKFKGSVGKGKKKTTAADKKRARTVGATKKTYERVYAVDPATGKRKLTWMYKDKNGKRRKIPHAEIIKTGYMKRATLVKARERAAKNMLEKGGAFVANASKRTPRQKRSTKRLAAFNASRRAGKTIVLATAAAVRLVPLKAGDSFKGKSKGLAKKKSSAKKKSPVKRKTSAKKTTTKRRSYRRVTGVVHCVPTKKRKVTKKKKAGGKMTKAQRSAAAKKGARTRKRNQKASSSYKKNGLFGRRRALSKKHRLHAAKRRKAGRGRVAKRKGTKRRGARRVNRRFRKMLPTRRMFRKNDFLGNLKQVLKTGAFVAGGFLSHKVVTGLVINTVYDQMEATQTPGMQLWKKPLVGLGVLIVGIPAARAVAKKNATEITAGMAASFIQSVIVSTLVAVKQDTWAQNLSGYSESRAYGLRGPVERRAASIAPQYSRLSGYQQAAAGFQQAAAGFQQAAAGTGEYFESNATGEFFAPNSLEGVGSYEGAGQLAMQASAGVQDIDDGIRPDSDIDGIMDLAEAAAGLRGMGEFYSAVQAGGGRVVEKRVGETSQWVPSGPLWAGADSVQDTQATSELSAGILQRGGGNGVLSAG